MPDILSVELVIDDQKATVKLDNFQQKMKLVSDDITRVGGDKTFAGKMTIDLEKLSRQADETYKKFKEVANARLDNGQVGLLTKEILSAQNRSRQLAADIINIRKELANPNRKSSIAFLTDELRAAEREADLLNRKLSTVSAPNSAPNSGKSSGGHFRGAIPRVIGFGAAFREFAPEGINEGLINTASQLAGVAGISAATLATFGGIAVAGAAIVKVTQNIKEEAAKHLKIEEDIAIAVNKQILSQQEALQNQAKLRQQAAEDFQFNKGLPTQSLEELTHQRDLLVQLNRTTPAKNTIINPDTKKVELVDNPEFQRNTQQILALETRMRQLPLELQKRANDSFNKRFEDFSKSQENAIEAEKKHLVLLEKQKEKFIDLRNTLGANFSQQFDNPLVKMMTDFDSVTEKARKEFGIFGDEVVNKISSIEKANLTKAIGLQNFDNNFAALKYSQNARQLQAMPETQFASFGRAIDKFSMSVDFIAKESSLSRNITENGYYLSNYNPNNPKSFNEYNKRFFNDDTSDIGLQIRHAIEDVGKIKSLDLDGTGALGKGIAADRILSLIPSLDELVKRLNSPYTRDDARQLLAVRQQALFDSREAQRQKFEDSLQQAKNLEFGKKFAHEQIDLINKNSALTDAQKAQRRLSVTDALGNDLDSHLQQQRIKDFVSAANDKKNQEAESFKLVKEIHGFLKTLTEGKKPLPVDIGSQATFNLNVQTNDSQTKTSLVKTPNAQDTANAYSGGTFYGDYENR